MPPSEATKPIAEVACGRGNPNHRALQPAMSPSNRRTERSDGEDAPIGADQPVSLVVSCADGDEEVAWRGRWRRQRRGWSRCRSWRRGRFSEAITVRVVVAEARAAPFCIYVPVTISVPMGAIAVVHETIASQSCCVPTLN